MSRHRRAVLAVALALAALAAAGVLVMRAPPSQPHAKPPPVPVSHAEDALQRLFAEIQPVQLANCELERFGEPHDGGYLLCGNLLGQATSAYSYGISGYDQWGCDVSRRLGVQVHEYDCFDLTQPSCPNGRLIFHAECIGDIPRIEEARIFDTLENQIRRNGDAGKHLVVKMDVEGSEWASLLDAPGDVLRRIDQMAVEFHGFDQERFIQTMEKLKRFFYIAHLHWNNFACDAGKPPFPSAAYEILFVNKRIGIPDPGTTPAAPSPLDRPNDPRSADCQVASANVSPP